MARLLVAMTLSLLLAGPAAGQMITAHRGASHDAPENTLAAFRLAWEQAADAIAECKRALPAIRAHLLMSFKQDEATGHWRPTAERIAATAQACGADGVGLQGQRQVLNRGFLDRLTAGGVGEFHVWTIDAPDDARAYRDLGAMGITTNRPTVIREALEGRKE